MDIFFKYYSGLSKDYFDNPTIKISPISKLNDPFESIVNLDIKKIALGYDCEKEFSFREVNFTSLITQTGIVSLTETPRNLLMWAHYAKQHEGICIGYKSNFLDHLSDKADTKLPVLYRPVKINYDNIRYEPHRDSFPLNSEDELAKKVILKTLLTKSDDWIYEKEHRAIIPLTHNDHIQFINYKIEDIDKGKTKKEKEDITFEYYKKEFVDIKKGNIKNTFTFANQCYADIHMTNDDSNLMYMINISPSSIDSIYFGSRTDNFDNCLLYRHIKSNPKTSHIKVYNANINSREFKLDITPFIDDLNDYIRP